MWLYLAVVAWVAGTIFDIFFSAYLMCSMKRWLTNHRVLGR
jgi:hypothetical protein